MDTLYLDPVVWDLALDSAGNIAMASVPYALAQDAASAIRTFLGEVWYDTELGVPYFQGVFGVTPVPSIPILKALLIAAAKTVPGVVDAKVFIQVYDLSARLVTGQVQVTDKDGVLSAVPF